MLKLKKNKGIPTNLDEKAFNTFILPYLPVGKRGPKPKISSIKTFSYIMFFLYTGCQWHMIPIEKDASGEPEIHYSTLHKRFRQWQAHGSFDHIFLNSVDLLHTKGLLDLDVLHGDGTTTAAKKGGDNIGFNGHKHMKGDKVVAISDRNGNVIAPFVAAPGNQNESPMFKDALHSLKVTAKAIGFSLIGLIMSLDGVFDSRANRKMIFNAGMTPNIPENKRNRKNTKRGRKRTFSEDIFAERFEIIERIFAWEDKFKRLLVRFERISKLHYALKLLAYTMINLRHFV